MTLRVPYIADEAIERDAEALLAQYAHARGVEIRAPIPIEDIVEKHLKLRVEFDDTAPPVRCAAQRARSGSRHLRRDLASTAAESSSTKASIPRSTRRMEGRYRFTLAHEGGGHWRLHRGLVRPGSRPGGPVRGCSGADRDLPIQPGQGAGGVAGGFLCFLPADAAPAGACRWEDRFGRTKPLVCRTCARTNRSCAR